MFHFKLLLFFWLLNEFPFVVLLSYSIRDMCRYGSQFLGPLNVEHLVVEEDVRSYLLQQGPLWSPSKEEGLINFQAPVSEGLQDTSPRARSTARSDQEGSYRAINTLVLLIKFSLEVSKCLQETLQWTL